MRKFTTFGVLALLVAAIAGAQGAGDRFAGVRYDVDSTNLTYCATVGPTAVGAQISTSGSSTTISAAVAGGAPFRGMAVGDVLAIQTTTTPSYRRIVTWTNEDTVVVELAINLTTATSFSWYRNTCGTTAADGWVAIPSSATRVGLTMQFETGDITTLSARWECRVANTADIVIIYPGESSDCGLGAALSTDRCDFAAAKAGAADGSLTIIDDAPVYSHCRVGLAYKTADTSDVGAAMESVTVTVSFR